MRSSGLAAISSAQADGSWDAAYASQANMEVPPDLASALAAAPEAKTMFARSARLTGTRSSIELRPPSVATLGNGESNSSLPCLRW